MTPSFYWGVFVFLLVQAVVIGISYGRATTRIDHLEKARKDDGEETSKREDRLRAVETKPAQDLSAVAEKVKADLQRTMDDRVSATKLDFIKESAEIKMRVKDIETARAKELTDKLEAANAEVERLKNRQSLQSSAHNQAVRAPPPPRDARRDPSEWPPGSASDTETPPPPLPPRPERRR